MAVKHTALVTGGNRGIGFAIVQGLAARGDTHVLLAARVLSDATEAATRVEGNITPVHLDLLSPDIRKAQALEIHKAYPQVDILINNAGVLEEGGLLDLDEVKLNNALQVNYLAAIDLIRIFAPSMEKRGFGRIVNMSSGWGSFDEGLDGPASYSMTKAALNAVTLSVSRELQGNLKINSCCPGWVRTRMGGPTATRAPEHGADTPIWLATLPEDGPTGGFFRDRKSIPW
jgi:NAD(P)-dependent dehydrogenase (short-subunit alcohol dehydrogenase family)